MILHGLAILFSALTTRHKQIIAKVVKIVVGLNFTHRTIPITCDIPIRICLDTAYC